MSLYLKLYFLKRTATGRVTYLTAFGICIYAIERSREIEIERDRERQRETERGKERKREREKERKRESRTW